MMYGELIVQWWWFLASIERTRAISALLCTLVPVETFLLLVSFHFLQNKNCIWTLFHLERGTWNTVAVFPICNYIWVLVRMPKIHHLSVLSALITLNNTPLLHSVSHNNWTLAVLSDDAEQYSKLFSSPLESLPLAAAVVFLFPLFPEHWAAQVLAVSSLRGSKVIFWCDDSQLAMQFCCVAQHCGPALRWDRQIYGSTQLASAPANCGCSPSQMFMQPPHWQHLALCVDLIHKHS